MLSIPGYHAPDAPETLDAPVGVNIHLGRRSIDVPYGPEIREPRHHHVISVTQCLKLTVPALLTGWTHMVPFNKKPFNNGFSHIFKFRNVVLNYHIRSNGSCTRSHVPAADLYCTDAACSGWLKAVIMTEDRNINTIVLGGLNYCLPPFSCTFLSIYGKLYLIAHINVPLYLVFCLHTHRNP